MKNLFSDLEHHMKTDHLLLHLVVYLSTEDDVNIILDDASCVPVHIFALHISNQCQQYDRPCQKKVHIKYIRPHVHDYVPIQI